MLYIKSNKKKLVIFLSLCFVIIAMTYFRVIFFLPTQITLFENQNNTFDIESPFFINIKADNNDILIFESQDINVNKAYKLSNPIVLKPQKKGRVNLDMRLFGLITLKTMQVDVVPYKEVVACGNTVGVKIKIDGILVIGLSEVETPEGKKIIPAKIGGIKPGDLIMKVNNVQTHSIEELVKQVEASKGKDVTINYKRGTGTFTAKMKPCISVDDKKYHLGMWVRDSTAGIGTLTFYDPESKGFGALGHGITDIDTGALMPVDNGEIVQSSILAVEKGRSGTPGELKGILVEDCEKLGTIYKNSEYGIYGKLNERMLDKFSDKIYPIGLRNQISEGEAKILANIDGKSVQEYNIEIQKLSKRNSNGLKGMIIKVTDKRLLDTTGGIVQGMSGSPIVQNGKLVGAVTHVLVNDPTRGYGIFIENMIKNMINANGEQMKKAS